MNTANEKKTKISFLAGFGLSFFTAFFISILESIFVIAFAALIYSGELSSEVPRATGFILLGDAILCFVIAALSSYGGFISVEQDVPGAMQGVIAAGIIATLAGNTEAEFATVTLMIVTTTLITSVLLLALGYFKLGGLVRFLPYPVIGGFLAGSGWLLIQGGLGIIVNIPLGLGWLSLNSLMLWMPGLILGYMVYYLSGKFSQPYTIPAILMVALALFYGVVAIAGISIPELREAGWLLETQTSSSLWEFPLSPGFIANADLDLIVAQLPSLFPIAIITVVALLLNVSGTEVIIKKDVDVNRELMVAGTGNLLAGMAGGLVGFQDISFSSLNRSMTGGKRLVGILTGLMLLATVFIGTSFITYIPKFIFGAVLVYLGFELFINWVYNAWLNFSRIEFIVVASILVTLVTLGVAESVVIGLIMAVIMFVVSYSRVSVVKFALTGNEYRSRVTRAPHEVRILEKQGDRIFIMKLEGFIFFGTASGVFDTVRSRLESARGDSSHYCLLDFSRVSGVDSTGMLSFDRMIQWCQEQGVTLILSGLSGKTKGGFMRSDSGFNPESLKLFPSLDRALEWCENSIISSQITGSFRNMEVVDQLNAALRNNEGSRLLPYLEYHEYKQGEYLIREGDTPDLLYFVHSGQVTALLESHGKDPVRLETMNSGRTVGELGFYLGTKRAASVIADQDSVVYSLSSESLKRMEAESPEAASAFHRLNSLLLSERVTHLIRTVSALERA